MKYASPSSKARSFTSGRSYQKDSGPDDRFAYTTAILAR